VGYIFAILMGLTTVFGLTNKAEAKGFKHLIEGGLELSSLKIKGNGGGTQNSSNFDLRVNYWHRTSARLYLVGNLQFSDRDLGADTYLFAGGAAYNMASNARGDFEIGPGFRFGLTSLEDESGFLFGPYLFVRNFLNGSRTFITFELGYTFAFLDDIDYRGFISTVALGVAF
jgi:hypothetical protein